MMTMINTASCYALYIAMTFTRNAANEMRKRVADYLAKLSEDEARSSRPSFPYGLTGQQANELVTQAMDAVPRVQTYHAFALWILRRYIDLLGDGYSRDFSLCDRKVCVSFSSLSL